MAGGMFPGWELLLAPVFEALLWPLVTWVLLAPQRRPPIRIRIGRCDHVQPRQAGPSAGPPQAGPDPRGGWLAVFGEPGVVMTEIRNVEQELSRFNARLLAAAAFVLVGFGLLGARLRVHLQVVKHEELSTLAENNRIAVVPIVPNRGLIVDRNGVVLANNYSAYTLEITPSKVDDLDGMIDRLAEVVDIQPRDRKRFKRLLEESKSFESLPIRTKLTDDEVARFTAQRFRFPGVDIKARLFRNYPLGEPGTHVLGYIGRINQAEKEAIDDTEDAANYRGTEYIGKLGVEQSYEAELHGTTGVEEVETSAAGRPVRRLKSNPATPGNKVVLADRHPAAGAGRADVRRPARCARRAGPAQRRSARLRQQADLRPEPVRRRHRQRVVEGAQRVRRQAAAQPRAARHLPAGFDLQALHGDRRAEQRQAQPQPGDLRRRHLPVRQPHLPQPRRRRARAGGHGAQHRQVEQRLLLLAGQRDSVST